MTDISLETIVRTIFGGTDRATIDALMNASSRVVASSHPLLFFSSKTHFPLFGWSPWDRWQAAKQSLFGLLDRIVGERARYASQHSDVLSLLCNATYEDGSAITREHLYSELMTFLFAGHETTALSMTWGIYHLLSQPTALKRLQSELDALPDDRPATLAAAPYLKATVQEILRIHPIVTETLRLLKAPLQLGDFHLPAGICVAPATVLAHHNPSTYPEPDTFLPERFLDRTYSPFQYMPFGGGHRRCIGAAFASYEMAIVLGTLFRRYTMTLIESQPVVPKRRNVTIGPSSAVPIRVLGTRSCRPTTG
jgi:cytochrome P450